MSDPSPPGSSPFPELPPGTWLGRFELKAILGSGSFSEVFLARDARRGRLVSLKLLSESPSLESVARHQRETQALKRLIHPRIPEILDSGEEKGRLFLSLRYVVGVSLRACLKQGKLSLPEAIELLHGITEALVHCHAQGVIHRDLKPENLLVDTRGQGYLLDFGIALLKDKAGKVQKAGTRRYMAPEQLSGKPLTEKTDVYQMGLVLFETLVGRPRFRRKADTQEQLQDRAHPVELPEAYPESLRELVSDCTQPDPEERPPSQELLGRLEKLKEAFPPSLAGSKSKALVPAPETRPKPKDGPGPKILPSSSPPSLEVPSPLGLPSLRSLAGFFLAWGLGVALVLVHGSAWTYRLFQLLYLPVASALWLPFRYMILGSGLVSSFCLLVLGGSWITAMARFFLPESSDSQSFLKLQIEDRQRRLLLRLEGRLENALPEESWMDLAVRTTPSQLGVPAIWAPLNALVLPGLVVRDLFELAIRTFRVGSLGLLLPMAWGSVYAAYLISSDPLTRVLGLAFLGVLTFALFILSVLGHGFMTMRVGGLPLYRKDVYIPLALEYMAPGTGVQAASDSDGLSFLIRALFVLLILSGIPGLPVVGVLAWVVVSATTTLSAVNRRLDQTLEQETRLLVSLEGTHAASARCQAGMSILTAQLIKSLGKGTWKPPEFERNLPLTKDPEALRAARKVPEVQECLKESRLRWMRSKGQLHLFCERHNLCPRPMPQALDREASTAGGSTEGGTIEPTLVRLDEPEDLGTVELD